MLFIPIPNGETVGKCNINSKPCEFVITDGLFSFRAAGSSEPWDRRKIMAATEGEQLTNYVCASKDGSTEDVVIIA
jgi:hypothetical protein